MTKVDQGSMAYTPQTSRRKVYPHGSRGPRHDRVKDDALLGTLKTALEGLFSDANWSTDEAFKSLADSKGWIPLVRQIRHSIMMIVCAGGMFGMSHHTSHVRTWTAAAHTCRASQLSRLFTRVDCMRASWLDNRRPAASVSQVRLIQLPVIIALFPGSSPSIQTIQHALKVQQSKLIQVHRNGSCTSVSTNATF